MAETAVDEKSAEIPAETEETDESNYDLESQKIRTSLSMQDQKFEWGLVSLNTRKSIYRPGEIAEFVIVALDRDGRSVCGASIDLVVTAPDNINIFYSTANGTISSGECGLYYADYLTEKEGSHIVDITADINGIEVTFSTYFLVQENYEFDIIRTAQSKIDPTLQDWFDVTIDIESFVGGDSFVVKEFVPAEFEIITDAGVEIMGDAKVLTWDLALADNKASVGYSYSVPHVWPYLYALGPLEIDYDSQTFTEARPWYVAVDPDLAPVIESYTDIAVLSEATFDVNLPSGTVAGNLLLAIIAKDDDPAMYSSHGFNDTFDGGIVGVDHSTWCWHKIANSSDIARGYVTFTGDSEDYVGRMYRITGFDPDTPIDVVDTTGATGASDTPQAPSIITVTDNTLVFAVAGMDDNDVPYSLVMDGWTQDLNTSVTTAGIVIATKVMATAGHTVNAWDVSTAIYLQDFYVGSKEVNPEGLFFNPDGTKMYTIGRDGVAVDEFNLGTAWDVSTAVYSQDFDVSAKEASPQGLFFKSDGLKMYTIGTDGYAVDEYNLSTAWDVSTAVYVQEFYVGGFPRDLFFKPDGLKMYTIESSGDTVYEYNLSTAWDVSTAVYVQDFYIGGKDSDPRDLFFSPDGSKMYTIGWGGWNIDEYSLSTVWNVSTAVYSQELDIGAISTHPSALFFKPDGLKVYTIGSSDRAVDEYNLEIVKFTTSASDGWAAAQVAIRANNPPTVVLNSPEDTAEITDTTPTLNFTGTDPDSDDIEYQVQVNTDSVFDKWTHSQEFIVGSKENIPQGLFFKPDGTKMYTIGYGGYAVDEYNLGTAWNVSTAVYYQDFSVSAQETMPRDLFFKSDGLKMYTIGTDGDAVDEYNLSTAWDVSTAVYYQDFSVSDQDTLPTGVFFKPDGLKMYMTGYGGDSVYEYNVGTAWDVSTAVYSQNFSVSARELTPQGLFFKSDGLKMYTMGYDGKAIDEYDLSTAWNVSTAVYSQELYVGAKERYLTDLFFKPDGLKIYTIGNYGGTVDGYDLETAWNISTAVYFEEFIVGVKELVPLDLFFKPDGTKMYMIGSYGDIVNEYNLSIAWDVSTAVYFEEFYVGTRDLSPEGLFFKPDGTKMYTIGSDGDTVDEYNLSIAWDVSSAVYSQEFSVSSKETSPNDLFFKPDGTVLFIPKNLA